MTDLDPKVEGSPPAEIRESKIGGGEAIREIRLAVEISRVFSDYLSDNDFEDRLNPYPAKHEDKVVALVSDLQKPEALSNSELPVTLRSAIAHISVDRPSSTIGYVREALVHASEFVGTQNS